MMDEFKTTVISFDKNVKPVEEEVKPEATGQINVNDPAEENVIKNVLFNVTTKVPHVTTSIPVTEVKPANPLQKIEKIKKGNSIESWNKNFKSIPKFYLKELNRYRLLVFVWIVLTILCIGLETWAMVAIFKKAHLSNWVCLTLIPAFALCIAFLIVYTNNYLNYRSEARTVNFNDGKIVTNNVVKLYKRLKTGHINVNWFCLLAYVASLLAILFDYIVAWAKDKHWGNLDPSIHNGIHAYRITLIVAIAVIFVAFFLHIYLLVTNYTRAAKIDNFYSVQIVSDEDLNNLKKRKNKRNALIFIGVIICVALIGMLIYKIVNSKKQTNNVTINN